MDIHNEMKNQKEVTEVATLYLKRKWKQNHIRSLNIYAEFIEVPSRSTKALVIEQLSNKKAMKEI